MRDQEHQLGFDPMPFGLREVQKIEDKALAMGWTPKGLRKLAAALLPGDSIASVTDMHAEIIPAQRAVQGFAVSCVSFGNPDRIQQLVRACVADHASRQ